MEHESSTKTISDLVGDDDDHDHSVESIIR